MVKNKIKRESRRIFELDLLRGFFVIVIIIDHLQMWPSPLRYITGEGRLWVTAAEGFFLISGLLIGYVRGFKGRSVSLKKLSSILLKRAGLLYIWGVGITCVLLAFAYSHNWNSTLLPALPSPEQTATPFHLMWAVVSAEYFSPWIYFLRLYALMLLVTPVFLWLLRRNWEYIIILLMAVGYWIGLQVHEAALQWQVLFFGAALVGYKFEAILAWFRLHPKIRLTFVTSILLTTMITMGVSYFFTHGWEKVEDPNWQYMSREEYMAIRAVIAPYVTLDPLTVTRVALSFIWFIGLLVVFRLLRTVIMKRLGWLLLPLGQRSLSSYCLQALVLPLIVVSVTPSEHEGVNAAIAIATVLAIWGLLQLKFVQKTIPQ